MKSLRILTRAFSLIKQENVVICRQAFPSQIYYQFSEKNKKQEEAQKQQQKDTKQAKQEEKKEQVKQQEQNQKKESQNQEKVSQLEEESHEDKLHRVEQYYSKQITKLEQQVNEQKDKLHDQVKLINQLEASNKEHNSKIKELRDVLKAELEEQELQQKRALKEKEQLKVFAITNFAKELLDVQDNLERAVQSTTDKPEDNPLLEGVILTHQILVKVYQKFGVAKMEALGKKFDPNFHESLFQVEDAEKEPGTICYVAQEGYVIGERVLRPAKVGVVKQQQ